MALPLRTVPPRPAIGRAQLKEQDGYQDDGNATANDETVQRALDDRGPAGDRVPPGEVLLDEDRGRVGQPRRFMGAASERVPRQRQGAYARSVAARGSR